MCIIYKKTMFKFMSEINLEFVDRTEEWNEAKYMRKFMED